jgi:hypothetical protein
LGTRLKAVAEDLIKKIDALKGLNESLTSQNKSLTSQLEIAREKPPVTITIPIENEETKFLRVENASLTTEIKKLREDLQSETKRHMEKESELTIENERITTEIKKLKKDLESESRHMETNFELVEMTKKFKATSDELTKITVERDNLMKEQLQPRNISPLESATVTTNVASIIQQGQYFGGKPAEVTKYPFSRDNSAEIPKKVNDSDDQMPKPEFSTPKPSDDSKRIRSNVLLDNVNKMLSDHSQRFSKGSDRVSNNNFSTPNSLDKKQNSPGANIMGSIMESKTEQTHNSVNTQNNTASFGINPANQSPTPNISNNNFSNPNSRTIQNNPPLGNLMSSDAATQLNGSKNFGNDSIKKNPIEEEKSDAYHNQNSFVSNNYNPEPVSYQGGQGFNSHQQGVVNRPLDDVSSGKNGTENTRKGGIKILSTTSISARKNENPNIIPGEEDLSRTHQRQVSSGGTKVVNLQQTIQNLMASNMEPNEILHVEKHYQDLNLAESIYNIPPK